MTDEATVPPFASDDIGTALRRHWESLVADMEATADEFRAAGWDVLELHPGDVTVVTESNRGFDVLVPDDEFDRLRDWTDGTSFPDHQVYRSDTDVTFLLLVLESAAAERAICCPLYFDEEGEHTLRTLATEDGVLRTHIRNLAEEFVHFRHDQPAPFFTEA